MPDRLNDFTMYMGQPPMSAWGPQLPGGHMGASPFWSGSPVQNPSLTWGGIGGSYAGNIGMLAGGIADRYMPPSSFGLYPGYDRTMSFMQTGQHAANSATMQHLAMEQQMAMEQRIQHRIRQLTGNQGIDFSSPTAQLAISTMANLPGVQNALGGALSQAGLQSLTGAMSGQYNGWRPSAAAVAGLQQSFSEFYGFTPGGRTNISRTLGLGADDLAGILSVHSSNLGGAGRRALEAKAAIDVEDFNVNVIGAELDKKIPGIKDAWTAAMRQAGGDAGVAVGNLRSFGTSKEITDQIQEIVAREGLKRFGTSAVSVSSLANQALLDQSREVGRVFTSLKDAGYEGTVTEMYTDLERIVGAEKFDTAKMRQLAERMRGITQATGMALSSVFGLFEAIDKSTLGGSLGTNRASYITAVAGATRVEGVTNAGQMAFQTTIANALANPAKSVSGMAMDLLSYGGRGDLLQQYSQMDPAQRQGLLSGAIYSGASSIGGLDALIRGHTDIASGAVRALETVASSSAIEYNSLAEKQKKGALSQAEASRMAALRTSIEGLGGSVGADGRATVGTGLYDKMRFAADESLGFMSAEARGRLAGVGAALGIKDTARAETAGAMYSVFLERTGGDHAEAQKLLAAGLQQQNISYDTGYDRAALIRAGASAQSSARAAFGDNITNFLDPVSFRFRTPELDLKMTEENNKRASLTGVSSTLGSLGRFLGGVGTKAGSMTADLMGALGEGTSPISPSTRALLTKVLGSDVDQRDAALGALSSLAGIETEMMGLSPGSAEYKRLAAKAARERSVLSQQDYNMSDVTAFLQDAATGNLSTMTQEAQRQGLGQVVDRMFEMSGKLIIESTNADGTKTQQTARLENATATPANAGSATASTTGTK